MDMNTRNLCKKQGFTIIELMIVLVILAVLLALAYPSYIDYVRKANRGDAQQLLLNWAVNQEIFRSNHACYANTSAPNVCDPIGDFIPAPQHDKFTFTIANVGATTYTLQAEALGDQANDTSRDGTSYCGGNGELMTLTQNGQKEPADCWD